MRYTGVLAFNTRLDRVLLVHKTRGPKQLIGTWNGIGGKMEVGESPVGAAVREFAEETGYAVTKDDLVYLEHQRWLTGHDAGNEVYWYATRLPMAGWVSRPQMNDVGEVVLWFDVAEALNGVTRLSPNMGYMIPKAQRFLELPYLDRQAGP